MTRDPHAKQGTACDGHDHIGDNPEMVERDPHLDERIRAGLELLQRLDKEAKPAKPVRFYMEGKCFTLVKGKFVRGKWIEEHYEWEWMTEENML